MVRPFDHDTPQLGLRFHEPKPTRRTWQVRQLVAEARDRVEEEFGDVWVEGEISNFRPASSGHVYFTLKDAEAQLSAVLFRRQAMLLRFRPEDGMQVRLRGKVTIYEQRGQLQIVADMMEPVGAGSLQLAFEQLRDRLKAEGLFEQSRKRPLPAFPRRVAVITSRTGAVIRDFLNVAGRRHSALEILLVPVAVQGDAAPGEIEAALAAANGLGEALAPDLIVLARGGGSLEDLAAFNSERVARAIVASRLPVVSAIGHETDFTIADFVADLRAPTPSAAAELVTEAQHKIGEHLAELRRRLDRAMRFQLLQARQKLTRLPLARAEQRMAAGLHRRQQRLDELQQRLEEAMAGQIRSYRETVAELQASVLGHDPRRQLGAAREQLAALQARLDHSLERSMAGLAYRAAAVEDRLYRAATVSVAGRRSEWAAMESKLRALSPLAVLERGYALVQDEDGRVVRSVAQLSPKMRVRTRVADGEFSGTVEQVTKREG